MPAQLLALTKGPNILLDKPILLFGRNPECDIQIDSRKISRRHCCIAQVSDYLVIRDLGSTNGVRINGVRVLEGKLRAGDEVTIGSHRYQVLWEGKAAEEEEEDIPMAMPASSVPPAVAAKLKKEVLESHDHPVELEEDEPAAAKGTVLDQDLPSVFIPDDVNLAPESGSHPGNKKAAPPPPPNLFRFDD